MCKLPHKVLNGQNLPHGGPYFTNYFVLSNFTDNLGPFSCKLGPYHQKSFFKIFLLLFSIFYSKMSKNLCKLRHKLYNAKTGVGLAFTWSNDACSIWGNWQHPLGGTLD